MFKRVPLAWLQLTHQKVRLLAAIAGIAFAVVLMLYQIGLLDALFDTASLVQSRLQGDLVVMSNQYQYLVYSKNFSRRRLYQSLAFNGVESVKPVYVGFAEWKNPERLNVRSILVIGYDPLGSAFTYLQGWIHGGCFCRTPFSSTPCRARNSGPLGSCSTSEAKSRRRSTAGKSK